MEDSSTMHFHHTDGDLLFGIGMSIEKCIRVLILCKIK